MTASDQRTPRERYQAVFAPRPELDGAARASARRVVLGTDVLTLLAAVWLIAAPYVLSYTDTGLGIDGYRTDAAAGALFGLAALVRLGHPFGAIALRVGCLAMAAWLVVAPFAFGYGGGTAPRATANEVAVGVLVGVLAAVSLRAGAIGRRLS